MAETGRSTHGPDERSALLPEHSLLSLSGYLDMQRSLGNETRFRILNLLVEEGEHSARELQTALDIESNTLHYHLDTLVDAGLVENRKRKEPTSDGLYSYYQANPLGEGIIEYGVRELMREEWELLGSSNE